LIVIRECCNISQLLEANEKPNKAVEKLTHYRRLVTSVSKFVDVHRLLYAIDTSLRQPTKTYSDLVECLDRLDVILSSLDLKHPLERQSYQVLQVGIFVRYMYNTVCARWQTIDICVLNADS
jgi:hypothetical protein